MSAEFGNDADLYHCHRMRVITVSADGRVTADALQPWSSVMVHSAISGSDVDFPAAEIPAGVVSRDSAGHEILQPIDGLRLVLDGNGLAKAFDGESPLKGPGIYMIVEVLC